MVKLTSPVFLHCKSSYSSLQLISNVRVNTLRLWMSYSPSNLSASDFTVLWQFLPESIISMMFMQLWLCFLLKIFTSFQLYDWFLKHRFFVVVANSFSVESLLFSLYRIMSFVNNYSWMPFIIFFSCLIALVNINFFLVNEEALVDKCYRDSRCSSV